MNIFVILAASVAIAAGKWNSKSYDQQNAHDGHKGSSKTENRNGNNNKLEQDHQRDQKHNNGRGVDHLRAPDVEVPRACDLEYVVTESASEIERCRDGKKFFYTDRYENKTFCSNSASVTDEECWWDTSIGSICLGSTECVWLTNRVEWGMCYCSQSSRCRACENQTPAPTVNMETSQCPDNCEIYYLGCVGMYCKCLGECTSSEEAGCINPVNAGCHSYFEKGDQDDRENDKDDTTLDQIIDKHGEAAADKIVNFIDEYGEGRYEIFGDFAYVYRDGLLMKIIDVSLLNLDDLVQSGINGNDWFDGLIPSESSEDNDNNWAWIGL